MLSIEEVEPIVGVAFRRALNETDDIDTLESEISRRTITQITSLYSLRHSVLPEDRKLFYPSLALHLQQPQSALRAWLHNHSSHLKSSHAQALSSNLTHTRPLISYF